MRFLVLVFLCASLVTAENGAMDDLLQQFMKNGDVTNMIQRMGGMNDKVLADISSMMKMNEQEKGSQGGPDLEKMLKSLPGGDFDWSKLASLDVDGLINAAMQNKMVQSLAQGFGIDPSNAKKLAGDLMDSFSKGTLVDTIKSNKEVAGIIDSFGATELVNEVVKMTQDPGIVDEFKKLMNDPSALQELVKAVGGNQDSALGALQKVIQGGGEVSTLLQQLGGLQGMKGLGGAPDPGARLRNIQQMMGSNQQDMLGAIQQMLGSRDPQVQQVLKQLGVDGASDDPEKAREVLAKLQTMMAVGGGVPKEVAVPMPLLWLVVLFLFAAMGGVTLLLVRMRAARGSTRRQKKTKTK